MNDSILRISAALALLAPASFAQVDRERDEPVNYLDFVDLTGTELTNQLPAGYRIGNLELTSVGNAQHFSGTFVENTGPYDRDWGVFAYGTYAELQSSLALTGVRIIDLERYVDQFMQERFVALWVDDRRLTFSNWNWLHAVPEASVQAAVNGVNGRVVDIETYSIGGQRYFELITVDNVGSAFRPTQLLIGTTIPTIQTWLAQGWRLYDFESHGGATCSCVLVQDGLRSLTLFQETYSDTYFGDIHYGARIIDVDEHQGAHVITMLDNTDPVMPAGPGCLGSNGLVGFHDVEGSGIGGTTLTFVGQNFQPLTPMAMHLGLNDIVAPLDLVGAPGCAIYTNPILSKSLVSDGTGAVQHAFVLPDSPAMHGLLLRTQFLGVDAAANALGVQFSNGLRTLVRHW
ncbi:MAG: hypothetical protein KDB80_18105 [Planctomycetes bacterium]|nr:hypothetical protein [Planctomycetota bacterium]